MLKAINLFILELHEFKGHAKFKIVLNLVIGLMFGIVKKCFANGWSFPSDQVPLWRDCYHWGFPVMFSVEEHGLYFVSWQVQTEM